MELLSELWIGYAERGEMMAKRKKETKAQQTARAEYMRLRRNIQAQQRREMKKYGTSARKMPEIPVKGTTARDIKKATKFLEEYRKTQFDLSIVYDSAVILENFKMKVNGLPEVERKLSSGEVSGKDLLNQWVNALVNTVGESRAGEIIRKVESETSADTKLQYENEAQAFIHSAMIVAIEEYGHAYEETDKISKKLHKWQIENTERGQMFGEL